MAKADATKIVRFAENFYDDRKGEGYGLFLKGGVYRVPADLKVPSCTQVLEAPEQGETVKDAQKRYAPNNG
jgi:hypothetical protein